MSVVAWDGKLLVADRRSVNFGLNRTTSKIKRIPSGAILAWVGNETKGLELAHWFERKGKFPANHDDEDFARLIVVQHEACYTYERSEQPLRVMDKFSAWGSGRDYAIATMHLGFNAVRAVEVASYFDINCGNGLEAYGASMIGEVIYEETI